MELSKLSSTVLLTSLLLMPVQMACSQELQAIYNATDGGVTLLYGAEQELLAGIRIDSVGEILVPGQKTDLGGTINCALCLANDQAPRFLEWGNLVGFKFDSAFAGNILPTGLSQQTLHDDLTLRFRTLAAPTVDRFGEFFVVPEPGTLGLVIPVTAMMLLNYRRRGDRCYV